MRAVVLAALALTPACDAYDEDLGPAPFLCGASEPRCPEGYACLSDRATGKDICFREGDEPTTFACADDTALEPNEALEQATATPLDAVKTYTRDNLAICPVGDSDLFVVNLATSGQTIDMFVTYGEGAATVRGSILSPAGLSIAAAMPSMDMPNTIEAHARSLSAGKYYARILGPATGSPAVNNYKLTIHITGP